MRLGLDFGTSTTVGVLHRPGGPVTPLLFDSSPLLPSAVHVGPDATVLTGTDAERAAVAYPAGLEPNPKRRIDDETSWLGEREYAVVDLIAAVLARQWAEASRVCGRAPSAVVLTHPAAWARTRLTVLSEAARRAGLPPVTLVPEPVAAAAYFVSVLGQRVPSGRALVVYDLGAGTFDLSVVRGGAAGFEVIATSGLDDVGGLDLDAVVVDHARTLTARASSGWARLDWPQTSADSRARRDLWWGARAAKELLSRHPHADLHIPILDVDLHITREEFEKAAQPYLDRTVTATLDLLRRAGVAPEHTAGVFLVGGSSRVPLIAALLHRRLRIPPTVIDQPELVVAQGCLYVPPAPPAVPRPSGPAAPPGPPAFPPPGPPAFPPPGPPAPAAPVFPPTTPPAVNGVPPRGVLPADFPVHLVELALGDRVGYTVRTYVTDDDGSTSAVFASRRARLPLFPRPEQASDHAAGTDDHDMTSVLHWESLSSSMATAFLPLTPDNRYRLDLVPVTLERHPKQWLIDLVIETGNVARELIAALDIADGHLLLGEGTLLDRLDDALRVASRMPFRRGRRELLAFDQARVVDHWRHVVAMIENRIDWQS
ncbi:Hsp70 family protein [Solwaraspora sp. WMMD406]|uniref:Hsp70 family protein n=1 Tax=Solwaraspora sp. WMMD406 TaxID=3016095 RepID=UPI0024160676|nr:Hsp70 family protein [Solwaraspora sp. WMMD406]MDG4766334.1 Hsp70 family protein [Solwaraspora sp. WMMD406]